MDEQTVGIDVLPEPDELWTVTYGDEYERLNERYEEEGRGLRAEDRGRVFNTATEILSRCPDPKGSAARRTGLAIGKVQSGKTMTYIALTALAFDSGYRVVIVLAGRTDALADQNKKRFNEDLIGSRSVPKIATFHNPETHDEAEIQTVLESDKVVLITLLKNQSRIGKLGQMLSSPELRRYPTLIIDDEGDQASLNTKVQKGEQSTVYANLLQMRDSLDHHAYVAFTATPQANLLIEAIDVLAPEFYALLEPGHGYTGGSTFFGPDRDKYIRIVPDDEANHDQFAGVPAYLQLSIATFLVAAAIRHLRERYAFHSMLIHSSNRTSDHKLIHSSVNALIDGWKAALLLPDTDSGTQAVLEPARTAYADLHRTVADCPSWEAVSAQLRAEIKNLKVWLVNSLAQGTNPSSAPFNLQNNIMVGGNMLDRGVTIPGLAVTYITRRVSNSQADTIEQRARWFGYKQSYLDLCRIFTSSDIARAYTELLSHEDDFWDSLRRNQAQGLPIVEWPRLFRLGLGLRPTRSNVARTRAFRSKGWIIQRKPTTNSSESRKNLELVRGFFKARPGASPKQFGNVAHSILPNCEPQAVIDLLAALRAPEGDDWDRSYVVEFLERLLLSKRLSGIDVLWMFKGDLRDRTMGSNGRINPMQGRSTNVSASSPDFYPGDRNIHDGRVQLQVHMVRVLGSHEGQLTDGGSTVALALYIPPGPQYDLGSLVIPRG